MNIMVLRKQEMDKRNNARVKKYPKTLNNLTDIVPEVEDFDELLELIKKNPKQHKETFMKYLNKEAEIINQYNL